MLLAQAKHRALWLLRPVAERLERERVAAADRPRGPSWDEVIAASAVQPPRRTVKKRARVLGVGGGWTTVQVEQDDDDPYDFDDETQQLQHRARSS